MTVRFAVAAASLLCFAACAPDRAQQRRDEVRTYAAECPAPTPSAAKFGPWTWGMSPAEVVAVTPRAWEESATVHAPMRLGSATGLATFRFRSGALAAISVLVPNRDGAEDELRRLLSGELGRGEATCKGCELKTIALTVGIVDAVLGTLALASDIAASASGQSRHFHAPTTNVWFPWYVYAQAEPGPRTIAWQTASTRALLIVDSQSLALQAEDRGAAGLSAAR